MNLRQINDLWNEYKEKYDLPEDIQILISLNFLRVSIFCI